MPIYATVGLVIAAIVLSTLQGATPAPAGPTIDDPEAYAVYAALVPLASFNDKPITNVAILRETVPGPLDCPREESIDPEWRPVVAD